MAIRGATGERAHELAGAAHALGIGAGSVAGEPHGKVGLIGLAVEPALLPGERAARLGGVADPLGQHDVAHGGTAEDPQP